MTFLALAAIGGVVAVGAAVWPLVSALKPTKRSINSADWVNRLFVLAESADAAGRDQVSTAARALIAALVAEKAPPVKG